MSLLNKLTIKNLKLNKKRTIVTIIGIMLSVSLITAVATMYNSAIKSLINFEIREKGDFHVAYYNVPQEEIDTFKNNRSIDTLNLVENIGYAKIDSKNEYKPYAYIKAFTKSSLNNLSIKLVEGRLPENSNEILIPTHLKTNGRITLNVGDVITLDVGTRVDNEGYELNQINPLYTNDDGTASEKIVNTTSKTYKVVGIIERPATNIEGYTAPGYTFITYYDENNLSDIVDIYAKYNKDGVKRAYEVTANMIGVDEVLFTKYYSGESMSEEEFNKYTDQIAKTKYDININDYLIDLETNPIKSSGIGGLGIVVGIVMAIIVVTSVFCIKNSFDISITEKIKQYGMLRSIGATKKQIKHNVFYEASILGLIGIPLGILAGILASYILIIVSNYYLGDLMASDIKLIFSFSFIAIIFAIILGIVTIYASAFKSAKKASRISPIDSIRNSGTIKINSKKVKSPKIINKLFGVGGDISYKNLKRNKKKYRTTVISIIVSVSVFIALTSFMSIAFDSIERELNISDYNLSLTATDYNEEEYQKLIATTSLDNILNYTILRESELKFSNTYYNQEYIDWINLDLNSTINSYISIISIGDYQYKKFIESLGLDYNSIKDKAILLDYSSVSRYNEEDNKFESKYLHVYKFKDHDMISGTLTDDSNFNIEIFKVTENKPFGLKNVNNALLISDDLFNKIYSSKVINIYYDSSNANKLQDDIDEALTGVDYAVNNIEESVNMMNNLFTLIGIFLYGFIIVISLIGITNIFNTITTNMELRRQEFAMLKSIGMTKKEFSRMISLESIFMGIKSLVFGIPIGLILSYLIHHYLTLDSGLPYKMPVIAILIAVITVFILIFIIMKYSMNKINKQNTIETIRNENI